MNLFNAKSLRGPVLIMLDGVLRKLYSVQNAIPLQDPELKRAMSKRFQLFSTKPTWFEVFHTYVLISNTSCSGFEVEFMKSIENTDFAIPSAMLGYSHRGWASTMSSANSDDSCH